MALRGVELVSCSGEAVFAGRDESIRRESTTALVLACYLRHEGIVVVEHLEAPFRGGLRYRLRCEAARILPPRPSCRRTRKKGALAGRPFVAVAL